MSECPAGGVLMWGMFDRGRMGRSGVSVWHIGLLVETWAYGPPDTGAVVAIGTSTFYCLVVASTSLKEHVGRVPALVVVEMHQGSSLTESIEIVSEKTSQKVASTSSSMLTHHSSCLAAIMALFLMLSGQFGLSVLLSS